MPPKGFDKFRAKIPMVSGKKIVVLPLYFIAMLTVALLIQILFDTLPEELWSSGMCRITLSFFPLIGFLIVGGCGFLMVFQMWLWRDYLKRKYGPTSYQRIVFVGFGGVLWIIALAVGQYLPFYNYAPSFWAISPLSILATPLDSLLGPAAIIGLYLKVIFGAIFLVIGVLMAGRALSVFGFDYMTVVYLYFPEESEIQENAIYSALRHPTYAGAINICLGGAIFSCTLFSALFFMIYLVGFYIHIHFVEERELIQRFGSSYEEYRKKVPAFFVTPHKVRTFFVFLFKGGAKSAA